MTSNECAKCGAVISHLPFRCKACQRMFCPRHKMPENHNCITQRVVRPKPGHRGVTTDNSKESFMVQKKVATKNILRRKRQTGPRRKSGPTLHTEFIRVLQNYYHKQNKYVGVSHIESGAFKPVLPAPHDGEKGRPKRIDLCIFPTDARGDRIGARDVLRNQTTYELRGVEVKIKSLDSQYRGKTQRERIRTQLENYLNSYSLTHLSLAVPDTYRREYLEFLEAERALEGVGLHTLEAGNVEIVKKAAKLLMRYYGFERRSIGKNKRNPFGGVSWTSKFVEVGTNQLLNHPIEEQYIFPDPYFYRSPIYQAGFYQSLWNLFNFAPSKRKNND